MKTNINNLESINKANPFKVPENYFAQFNKEIMDRLPEKEAPVTKTVPMWDRVKPWVYMAAMFVGLFFTIQLLTKNRADDSKVNASSQHTLINQVPVDKYWSTVQMTEEEFYKYLEEQLAEDGYYDYMYQEMKLNQNM
ncbi:MAG: hypothetical protein PHO94_07775 [Petrimonas sp.]|nr:hypothetical protein [Petrimonas sp.]